MPKFQIEIESYKVLRALSEFAVSRELEDQDWTGVFYHILTELEEQDEEISELKKRLAVHEPEPKDYFSAPKK